MNAINKKMLVIGVALLLSACAHYPRQHEYYPGNNAYSSGYTIMHKNYYGERPNHYDNGYGQGNVYFPHHRHHDQYNSQSRWGNDYSGHQHQQDRNREHPLSHENSRRHDGGGDNHNNNFDRRNRHQQFTDR